MPNPAAAGCSDELFNIENQLLKCLGLLKDADCGPTWSAPGSWAHQLFVSLNLL